MKMLPLLLVLLSGPAVLAQTTPPPPAIPATGHRLADFIPAGYDTLRHGYATGDLNHDGRPDVAALLYPLADATDAFEGPAPQLIILFGTPRGYALAARSNRIVLCAHCGGQGSNPFSGLAIRAGVLTIEHFTYTGWYRRTIARFRYQQNDFYLIGELMESGRNNGDCPNQHGPAGWEFRDTNFITGEYEAKRISEECRLLVNKRGKSSPKPLRKLADYAVQP